MDEKKAIIDDESRWPSYSRIHISHLAPPSPIEVDVDELDEGDEDSTGEITAVESSILAKPRSGDSGPYLEDLKGRGGDDPELRLGKSSPPPPEAKGDHPDGEDEDKTEIAGLPLPTSWAEPPSSRSANQDIDTEYDRMSTLDISTMKIAVQSGDPKAVDDLMESLSDTLAVDELTTTYGDGTFRVEEDKENILFKGTSPILHAARSGNLPVFKAVMKAMQSKLSQEKVEDMLAKNDSLGQSLLALAARSGSKNILEHVILVIRREYDEYMVKYMLAERDVNGGSPTLDMAARSGSKDVLEHVLSLIRREFSENKNVLAGNHRAACSLLASAIRSGSMDVVEHIFVVIRQEFSEDEVNEILQTTDIFGASLPACAASSGNSDVFKTVLNVATDKFANGKKTDMLSSKDSKGASLLALAVSSGNRNTVETVLEAITGCLTKDEVKGMLTSTDDSGVSVLARAVKVHSRDTFEAVLKVITHNLTQDEVKTMITSRDKDGRSLLALAIESESVEMFRVAMETVSDKVTDGEIKNALRGKDNDECSLLLRAARSGRTNLFKTVLDTLKFNLPEEQVKEYISSPDKFGDSLLSYAVKSGSTDMFTFAIDAISKDLTKQEAKKMFLQRSEFGGWLFSNAIETGRVEMFKAVQATVYDKLTEEEVNVGCRVTQAEGHQANEMISCSNDDGFWLLSLANETGRVEIFNAVMATVSEKLSRDEVKEAISRRDGDGYWWLSVAIVTGRTEMVNVAMATIVEKLTETEVKEMILHNNDDRNWLLSVVITSGTAEMLKAIMATVCGKLTEEEVTKMISHRSEDVFWLLSTAIETRRVAMFKAVMDTVFDKLTEAKVTEMISNRSDNGFLLLSVAIETRSVVMFKAVMDTVFDKLTEAKVTKMILHRSDSGFWLLSAAIETGTVAMFKAVMGTVSHKLTEAEMRDGLGYKDDQGGSILFPAVLSGNAGLFETVLATVKAKLSEDQVANMLREKDVEGNSVLGLAALWSPSNERLFEVALKTVRTHLSKEEMLDLLCSSDGLYGNPIDIVVGTGNLGCCEIVLAVAQDNLVDQEMSSTRETVAEALDASFLPWARRYQWACNNKDAGEFNSCKRILSVLFRHSAYPRTNFFLRIVHDVTSADEQSWQVFTEVILSGVESAENPLVPGMAVSVALAEAAEGAREGEHMMFSSLQKRVDSFMLKILERLPQTVRGFEQRMSQCSALFEPEGPRNNPCGRPGPLRVAFGRRYQTKMLCKVALLMDYLNRMFMNGLPDMRDSGRVLQDLEELRCLAKKDDGDGFILGDIPGDTLVIVDLPVSGHELARHPPGTAINRPPPGDFKDVGFLRVWLQGANASRQSLTILPGAQFVIAGILAKPNSYYRVPALRMALDFVVYIMMLAAYSAWVLLSEDGQLTIGEITFACYILGAALKEVGEMDRDFVAYLQDRWNVLDVLALGILAAGFSFRLVDSGSPWGRALYALSAPLVFSRALFYAQYLPFQGSMVEVIFGMTMVLLQFVVILLVVMMGFAFALFPLLRDVDRYTFGDVLLLLFKTLLGDVEAFEEFDDSAQNRFSPVGQLLLVLYLVVMTVMLLNLLIAVLSTAHAKVEMNADKELEVSKMRIVEHYRLVVALDILPAPLNLVQFLLTLPFILMGERARRSKIRRAIDRTIGQVSFWLILSPVVVAAGTILWVASSVYTIFVPATELVRRVPTASDVRSSLSTVRSPFKWAALASLGVYGLLFPDKKSIRSAKGFTKLNAARLHIAAGGGCALGAPLCLVYLWLRGPCLWVFEVITAPTILRRFGSGVGRTSRTYPSSQDNENPNEQNAQEAVRGGSHPSRHENKQAKVQNMLQSRGVGVGDLHKYLEDPMMDPEVRPDEVERGATVKHIKLLRNRLEKRFNERVDRLEKKNSERFDWLEGKFNKRVDLLKNDLLEILRGGQRFLAE